MQNSFYREIINDHNLRPAHKHELENADLELRGVNPSCGDDILLKLRVADGMIEDGAFTGDGCAISQASADMMLDLVIGKSEEEAVRLAELFFRMIKGEATPAEIDELEEAGALTDVSHMPARVKCAVLGWHTLKNMFKSRSRDLARDSGQRQLTSSKPNPCGLRSATVGAKRTSTGRSAPSRSVYLSGRLDPH